MYSVNNFLKEPPEGLEERAQSYLREVQFSVNQELKAIEKHIRALQGDFPSPIISVTGGGGGGSVVTSINAITGSVAVVAAGLVTVLLPSPQPTNTYGVGLPYFVGSDGSITVCAPQIPPLADSRTFTTFTVYVPILSSQTGVLVWSIIP